MKKNYSRGFTLIELLVVIAIIGILASVILPRLSTARNKGSDASIEATLANARTQAASFYDTQTPNTYSGVCADQTDGIYEAVAQAGFVSGAIARCYDDDNEWVAAAHMKSDTTEWYCVDHKGASVKVPDTTKNFDTVPADDDIDCD